MASSSSSGSSSIVAIGAIPKKQSEPIALTGREIALISNDGQKLMVPPTVVRTSRILGKQLKDYTKQGKNGKGSKTWDKSFKLDQVDGRTLEHIIRWARHHRGGGIFKHYDDASMHMTPWDKEFLSGLEKEDIFKLALAGKDLEIEGILQLACKHIAKLISGKTAEEVRKEFGIECDFTPEEEEEIRKENELLFSKNFALPLEHQEMHAIEQLNWRRIVQKKKEMKDLIAQFSRLGHHIALNMETAHNGFEDQRVPPLLSATEEPAPARIPPREAPSTDPTSHVKNKKIWYEPIPNCSCALCEKFYKRQTSRHQ